MTLDIIWDRDGSAVTDDVTNLLHLENFNFSVFKEIIKSYGDCQFIAQDVTDDAKSVRLIIVEGTNRTSSN